MFCPSGLYDARRRDMPRIRYGSKSPMDRNASTILSSASAPWSCLPKEWVKGQISPGTMLFPAAGQKCPTETRRPPVSRKATCNSTPRVAVPTFSISPMAWTRPYSSRIARKSRIANPHHTNCGCPPDEPAIGATAVVTTVTSGTPSRSGLDFSDAAEQPNARLAKPTSNNRTQYPFITGSFHRPRPQVISVGPLRGSTTQPSPTPVRQQSHGRLPDDMLCT